MTEQQRYLFDAMGYVVVEDALSSVQLKAINEIIDQKLVPDQLGTSQIRWGCDPIQASHPHDHRCVLSMGKIFRDIIDNHPISALLKEVVGTNFRLDHDCLDVWRSMGQGPIGAKMHGGEVPWDSAQYYSVKGGRIHCGLVTVLYNLYDVDAALGGFACVPGSHKSEFPFPSSLNDRRNLLNDRNWFVRVGGKAGTAIVFAEAMIHGALPWRSNQQRRTLFYKFNNGATAWSKYYYDAQRWPDLSAAQKLILEPPNARHPHWYLS